MSARDEPRTVAEHCLRVDVWRRNRLVPRDGNEWLSNVRRIVSLASRTSFFESATYAFGVGKRSRT
jgi:hypothetical protein